MIVGTPHYVHRIGNVIELKYRADKENIGVLFHILRNQLYSRKLEAGIREYCTNAADIHMVVDQERPFEVRLPTPSNPTLRIRDFGTGLSLDGLQGFISMGKSDKRESPLLNGCMGIGCKSGHAYTDTYDIISRHENEYISATSFLDETLEGRLIITQQRKLGPNEEHGLEIIIPIREEDFENAHKTAVKILSAFEKPGKLFLGKQELEVQSEVTGEGIRINQLQHRKTANHVIFCGNVAYPLDPEAAGIEIASDQELILEMPLGSFAFSASRESIEYTKQSKDGIKNHIANQTRAMQEKVKNYLEKFDDPWTAMVAAWRETRMELRARKTGAYMRLHYLDALRWKGIKLPPHNKFSYRECLVWENPKDPNSPGEWVYFSRRFISGKKTLFAIPNGNEDSISVSKLRRKLNPNKDTWVLPALEKARKEEFERIILILQSKEWDAMQADRLLSWAPEPNRILLNLPNRKEEPARKQRKGKPKKEDNLPKIKYFSFEELEYIYKWGPDGKNQGNTRNRIPSRAKRGQKIEWWKNIQNPDGSKPRLIWVSTRYDYQTAPAKSEELEKRLFGGNVIFLASEPNCTIGEDKNTTARKENKLLGVESIQDAWKEVRPKNLVCSHPGLITLVLYLGRDCDYIPELKGLYAFEAKKGRYGGVKGKPPDVWIDKEQVLKETKIWEKLKKKFPLIRDIRLSESTDKKAFYKYIRILNKIKP